MITQADISTAVARVGPWIRPTPVMRAEVGGLVPGGELWWKCEFTQHSGSFKARGAFNRILAAREAGELTAAGVVAASGGNAGLAVAYAARELGTTASVYVPETAPAVKVDKLRTLGARVHLVGQEYAQAFEAAGKASAESGAVFCHAYDQVEICAGQGTLGVELLEQLPDVDTVLVSVGGGGLMAGIATAVAGRAKVVGVEPTTIPTLHTALANGGPVDIPVSGIAADSLGARRIGDIAYTVATANGVRSVLVDDEAIIQARRRLWADWRLAVEHGTAAAFAALITGAYRPREGERVMVILCGANTDPSDLTT